MLKFTIQKFERIGRIIEIDLKQRISVRDFVAFLQDMLNDFFSFKGIKTKVIYKENIGLFAHRIPDSIDYSLEWGEGYRNTLVISGNPKQKSSRFYIILYNADRFHIRPLLLALREVSIHKEARRNP